MMEVLYTLLNFLFTFAIRLPDSILLFLVSHYVHYNLPTLILPQRQKNFKSPPLSCPPTLYQRIITTFIKTAQDCLSNEGLRYLYRIGGYFDMMTHGIFQAEGKWYRSIKDDSAGYRLYLIAENAKYESVGGDNVDFIILYTHGGGFRLGHPLIPLAAFVEWLKIWKRNHNVNVQILSLEYPLAPEYPYPAARDHVIDCYEWLIRDRGLDPSKIAFAGDSAGGNLAAVTTLEMIKRRKNSNPLPLPAALLLISPLVHTATSANSYNFNEANDIISLDWMDGCADAYAEGTKISHESPEISPLLEPDLSEIPRFYACVGEYEVMRDDVIAFVKKARSQGVEVVLNVENANFHNFAVAWSISRNGAYERTALNMGKFFRDGNLPGTLLQAMTIKTSKKIPSFPTHGLLPKEETEAAAFIKKYPEYDGRNIVVAILDTGVDPGAAGLQVTTEGKPKIIDIVDCTGSGDVIMKTIVKPTIKEDSNLHVIQGLSGRSLIVNPDWSNPSGEFRVGIKRAYEIFPKSLLNRLQQEQHEKIKTENHKFQTQVQKQLLAWEELHPKDSTPSETEAQTKIDLEARSEILKDLLKKYEAPGPILDIVAFFDGTDWRVVVDVNESGDLRDEPLLTDYRKEHKYDTFSQEDLLNFCVNIYEDGEVVSIVSACGSHGTHVAAITAAYHPEEPELNGVAPGAQIISLQIGDSRLGTMETGAAIARAAIALVNTRVDIANMSFGEAVAIPNAGYFIELLRDEVINKYGCIFLSSAGNNGPALTTVGSPGGTSNGVIGVGAYVSHAMIQAEYALLESVPERPFTWTSRGPTTDGDVGIDIYAPGGAITSVPPYSLQKTRLMNGTSMSSPNACGCVTLLLSGLKAENKKYTPYRIKNAIVNSAKSIDDPFGVGFIQVDKAWNFLQSHYDRSEQDLSFEVKILASPRNKRGIYLREADETSSVQIFNVEIEPKFMEPIDPTSGDNNSQKYEFESRVALITTENWVRSPDFLLFGSPGRSFQIKVDPSQLSPGKLYYAEVQGYDTSTSSPVPLFKVPVTITKPLTLTNGSKLSLGTLSFGPGHIERHFVKVPQGATFADIIIKSSATHATDPARLLLHMIQLLPQTRYSKNQHAYVFSLGKGSYGDLNGEEQIEQRSIAVRGGVTLEICLAQFWSSPGNHTISFEITFHGIQLANNTTNADNIVYINGNNAFTRLNIVAPVRREDEINPLISFHAIRKFLRPVEHILKPLSPERDTLPNSRQIYGLQLTYTFKVNEKNTSVTPIFTAFFDYLYDAYFQDFFAIIFDANQRPLGYLDIYAKNFKLEAKGDYTIRVQIRHDSQELLEKFISTICLLEITLTKTKVTLDIFAQISDVYASKKSVFGRSFLEKGEQKALFVASPTDHSVFPKEAEVGDLLVGNLNLVSTLKIDGGQLKVLFVIPLPPVKSKESTPVDKIKEVSSGSKSEEIISQELSDSIRDTQITYLSKFPAESIARKELFEELEKNYPSHLPLLQTKLELLLETSNGNLTPEVAQEVVEVAEQILNNIDLNELSTYYGLKQELTNETAKKRKKEADEKKKAIVIALRSKAQALAVLAQQTGTNSSSIDDLAVQFEQTYQSLIQWVDINLPTTDYKTLLVYLIRERQAQRYGNAIKAINQFLAELPLTKENLKDTNKATSFQLELLKDLGWSVWVTHEEKWKLIRAPPGGCSPFY
ncbi:hypothetical protein G9A89_014234 [Geosiphon pyriformis]|nr:hypothetical protein G9A89_014234 [Geosiphon pyriformis]